mgnify:CR=1 FL=1
MALWRGVGTHWSWTKGPAAVVPDAALAGAFRSTGGGSYLIMNSPDGYVPPRTRYRLNALTGKRIKVKKFVWLVVACLLSGSCRGVTLYAQTLPTTLGANWNPNPASEAVIKYTLTVDGGTPIIILPSSCTPTVCTTRFPLTTWGSHTVSLVAVNLRLSSDPSTEQTSPASSMSFVLAQAPNTTSPITLTP